MKMVHYPQPCLVRHVTESDAEIAVQIAKEFSANSVSREHTANFLAHESNLLFAALAADEIAGFLTAHWLARFKDHRKQIFLYEIDVAPHWRRKGIGRALIGALLYTARGASADEVFVLTNKSNIAARRLYESTGAVSENSDDVMYIYNLR